METTCETPYKSLGSCDRADVFYRAVNECIKFVAMCVSTEVCQTELADLRYNIEATVEIEEMSVGEGVGVLLVTGDVE
jgi:hypothetical protein